MKELAQRIKSDPRGASAVVSEFLTKAVNEYVKLQGIEAEKKFDEIHACAASWAMLTGNTQALDAVSALAPASRARFLASHTSEVKAVIAANGGAPLSLDQLYARLPNFIGADNGVAIDQSWLIDLISGGLGVIRVGISQFGVSGGSQSAKIALNPNTLHHIFGKEIHNLGPVVQHFGSREAAFTAIQRSTEVAVREKGLTGIFETVVRVGGAEVTVRGAVVEGAVKVGTAFVR